MSKIADNKYLECGKIVNTHGIKGAVKIEPWCDSPDILADIPYLYFKNSGEFERRKVISATVMKRHVMAYIEGIEDIDTAASYKETVVYAYRDDIPLEEGDYFIGTKGYAVCFFKLEGNKFIYDFEVSLPSSNNDYKENIFVDLYQKTVCIIDSNFEPCLYVYNDGMKHAISKTNPEVNLRKKFNRVFIHLVYGKNVIRIRGNGQVRFISQAKVLIQ